MDRYYECHGHLMMDGKDFAAARIRHKTVWMTLCFVQHFVH